MSEHTKGEMRINMGGTIRIGGEIVGTIHTSIGAKDDKKFGVICTDLKLCWNNYEATAKHRDKLLAACKDIKKAILKLSDDADSERMNVQERGDYDFGYAEGKSIGLQTAESQIGKIIIAAKAVIEAKSNALIVKKNLRYGEIIGTIHTEPQNGKGG